TASSAYGVLRLRRPGPTASSAYGATAPPAPKTRKPQAGIPPIPHRNTCSAGLFLAAPPKENPMRRLPAILFVFVVLSFCAPFPAWAQVWVARYNGPGNGNDRSYSTAVDSSGNACVTGYSLGNGADYDIATIKYDPN